MTAACPLCGGTESTRLFRVTADQSAQCWAIREQEPKRHRRLSEHVAQLWGRDFSDWLECRSCGFGFSDPFVAGDADFYQLAYGESGYAQDKWEFRETLKVLQAEQLPDPRVLEVGAGDGHFLRQIAPRIVRPSDVLALEYNLHSLEKLGRNGFKAERSEVPELAARGERFGAIFMFQVLEHRAQPHELFSAFAQLLEPGGHLFVSVPNDRNVRFGEENGALFNMAPNHIGRWKARNFDDLAELYGFEVRRCLLEPFSLPGFVKLDLVASYMKRSQKPGTLANSLYAKRHAGFWRWANAAAVLLYAPSRIPTWIKAWAHRPDLGLALWAHLVRK